MSKLVEPIHRFSTGPFTLKGKQKNMNKSNLILGLGVVIALAVGVTSLHKPVVHDTKTVVKGISGPDITSPYLSINGVTTFYGKQSFIQASTTVCNLISPVSTSTIQELTVQSNVSTSTSVLYTIVKNATAFATSTGTILATSTIAANALGTINGFATTTTSNALAVQAVNDRTLSPLTSIVVTKTGGSGPFNEDGVCIADFQLTN